MSSLVSYALSFLFIYVRTQAFEGIGIKRHLTHTPKTHYITLGYPSSRLFFVMHFDRLHTSASQNFQYFDSFFREMLGKSRRSFYKCLL